MRLQSGAPVTPVCSGMLRGACCKGRRRPKAGAVKHLPAYLCQRSALDVLLFHYQTKKLLHTFPLYTVSIFDSVKTEDSTSLSTGKEAQMWRSKPELMLFDRDVFIGWQLL